MANVSNFLSHSLNPVTALTWFFTSVLHTASVTIYRLPRLFLGVIRFLNWRSLNIPRRADHFLLGCRAILVVLVPPIPLTSSIWRCCFQDSYLSFLDFYFLDFWDLPTELLREVKVSVAKNRPDLYLIAIESLRTYSRVWSNISYLKLWKILNWKESIWLTCPKSPKTHGRHNNLVTFAHNE